MTPTIPTQRSIVEARPGRWLARHVIIDGKVYGLSMVEVMAQDDVMDVSVSPFSHETHSTCYFNGTITVLRNPLRLFFEP